MMSAQSITPLPLRSGMKPVTGLGSLRERHVQVVRDIPDRCDLPARTPGELDVCLPSQLGHNVGEHLHAGTQGWLLHCRPSRGSWSMWLSGAKMVSTPVR